MKSAMFYTCYSKNILLNKAKNSGFKMLQHIKMHNLWHVLYKSGSSHAPEELQSCFSKSNVYMQELEFLWGFHALFVL
jgi:hypothetical protein